MRGAEGPLNILRPLLTSNNEDDARVKVRTSKYTVVKTSLTAIVIRTGHYFG